MPLPITQAVSLEELIRLNLKALQDSRGPLIEELLKYSLPLGAGTKPFEQLKDTACVCEVLAQLLDYAKK